jgi:hypothetical protein
MTLRKPSLFFRAIILGAQGVFYNLFCRFLMLESEWVTSRVLQSCLTWSPREHVTVLWPISRKKRLLHSKISKTSVDLYSTTLQHPLYRRDGSWASP